MVYIRFCTSNVEVEAIGSRNGSLPSEAFLLRHKHDKRFAALGERRRRTEIFAMLVEDLPSSVVSSNSKITLILT